MHDIKIPGADVERSRAWYESVLGLHVGAESPDEDGVVRGVAGSLSDASGRVVLSVAWPCGRTRVANAVAAPHDSDGRRRSTGRGAVMADQP
ncbi:MAG: VOC family protein [Pseudonocardia sp.]|nr:VOC family protein [Pseudonocardia sp.]